MNVYDQLKVECFNHVNDLIHNMEVQGTSPDRAFKMIKAEFTSCKVKIETIEVKVAEALVEFNDKWAKISKLDDPTNDTTATALMIKIYQHLAIDPLGNVHMTFTEKWRTKLCSGLRQSYLEQKVPEWKVDKETK